MTVIAVKKYENKVEMACDSRITITDDFIVSNETQKIHKESNRHGDVFYIGVCGATCTHQLFIASSFEYLEDSETAISHFIRDFHKNNNTDNDEWIDMIIVAEKTLNIYTVLSSAVFKRDSKEVFDAIGSGASIAIGALDANATPMEAVETTVRYVASCGGKLHLATIYKTDEKKEGTPLKINRKKPTYIKYVKKEINLKGKTIDEVSLPIRVKHCLLGERIFTIDNLLNYSEDDLKKIPNFGPKSLKSVKQLLKSSYLQLGGHSFCNPYPI